MKKFDKKQFTLQLIRARRELKRLRKHDKKKITKKAIRSKEDYIVAPFMIDIYNPKNYSKTIEFIESIRKSIINRKKVRISFRETRYITAAAGLLLLSEVDRITKAFGQSRIKCTRPPVQRDKYGKENRRVEAALTRIGFFKLLGMRENAIPEDPSVSCWVSDCGSAADGAIAGRILKKIESQFKKIPTKTLYRGCIEAISNCVEHAYIDRRQDGLGIDDKRWWMFAAVDDSKLIVIVCDLGVGIPNTVHRTQEASILDKLFSMFNFRASKDSGWIKAATLVKETRTRLSHRGKGGGDLRSLLKVDDSASLLVFSNRGCYKCRNVPNRAKKADIERLYDNKRSILGTIIQWSINLDSLS